MLPWLCSVGCLELLRILFCLAGQHSCCVVFTGKNASFIQLAGWDRRGVVWLVIQLVNGAGSSLYDLYSYPSSLYIEYCNVASVCFSFPSTLTQSLGSNHIFLSLSVLWRRKWLWITEQCHRILLFIVHYRMLPLSGLRKHPKYWSKLFIQCYD